MRLPLKYASLVALSFLGAISYASAQSQQTDIRPFGTRIVGDDITAHFNGQTLIGAYNFNQSGNPRSSYKETHNSDGTVLYIEGENRSSGRWGVFNDIVCYYYNDAEMSGGCFRVYIVENCYYFYDNNLPDNPDEVDGGFWTARSTINGETRQCEAAIS